MVRNTQAKIRRTQKKYGVDLSDQVDLPSIDDFSTRSEFNEWKAEQSRFTNRSVMKFQFEKNVYGVVASKQELFDVKRDTRIAQNIVKELEKQVKDKPFISGGRQQGTVGQRLEMVGKPNVGGIYSPPEFDFQQYKDRRGLEDKIKNMKERADPNLVDKRAEQMKSNFITALRENYNNFADDLIEVVKTVPAEDFYEMYHIFDEINFFYEDSEDKMKGKVEQLSSYFEKYRSGLVDMDLKRF